MARRRPQRGRIPLEHRLPNAPAVFVGRQAEVSRLTAVLTRAPVAVVRGPGGIGKTALVLHTIAQGFDEALGRTLYVPIPADEAPDQVRLNIAHLLAQVTASEDDVDIAGARGDPEELTAIALDLAEEGPFWVVLDDLQHTDREEMGELLRQLSAYARKSRWIATTRLRDDLPELGGQLLDLTRMDVTEMAEMAHELAPELGADGAQAAIAAASGSPWLMKQYLAAGAEGVALSREGVLETLSSDARALLRTLAVLEAPFDTGLLSELTPMPDDEELATMERRGLLIQLAAGLRVHDQVADFLFPSGLDLEGDTHLRAHLAESLGRRDEPEATLEALRLHGLAGRIDPIVALLDAQGHDLMGLGYAPRLWGLIGELTDRRLGLWQLRCAAELGNATVLAAVRPPELTRHEDRLTWAATQYLIGERAEARRIALDVCAATDDPRLRHEATLLSARALLHLGQPADAAAELDRLAESPSVSSEALGALVAACLDRDGTDSRVAAILESARGEVDPEALLDLATAFYRVAERARADEVVDRVLSTPRGGRASLLVSRRALLLRARIGIDHGELAEAERLLSLVRPYARGTSILRPLLIELDATRRLAVGDLAGLPEAIGRGIELAQDADAGITSRLRELLAETTRRCEAEPDPGDTAPPSEGSPWDAPDARRLRQALRSTRETLSTGDLMATIDAARGIRRDAARAGLRLLEAEALLVLADALFAGMFVEDLAKVTVALEDLADRLGAPRLRHHATFLESHGDVGALERLATETEVAPIAARRARALLSSVEVGDPIDAQVLAAAETAWADRQILTVRSTPDDQWSPAWGIDSDRLAVWLPDGRTVRLHKKPLLARVLATLADRGGVATKEQLINDAWGEPDYHPLRHDSKLHVSIRALRKAIEDDPGDPARVLTTDDGYALGGVVRRVVSL